MCISATFILTSGEALASGLPAQELLHQIGCKNIRLINPLVILQAPTFLSNQPLKTGASFTTTIYSFRKNGLHLPFIITINLHWPRWGDLVLEKVVIYTRPLIKILY